MTRRTARTKGRAFVAAVAVACATTVTVAGALAGTPAKRERGKREPARGETARPEAPGQPSAKGTYVVALRPMTVPIPVNQWLDFSIRVRRADGAKLALTELALDGGMPAHGHGLPTAPVVRLGDRPGEFIATGVRFNMAGRWELRVILVDAQSANGGAESDVATFIFDIGAQNSSTAAGAATVGTGGANAPLPGSDAPSAGPVAVAWPEEQRATLRSLWLRNLGTPPADPTNRVADDPRAVSLGHRLFFDRGLSGNGTIACATCHDPKRHFSDGRATGHGMGSLDRNTPSLVGVGFARWFFWDGRRDTAWSQALDPIEAANEMNGNRLEALRRVATDPSYEAEYRALFGPLPDLENLPTRASPIGTEAEQAAWRTLGAARQQALTRAFVNIGKAIAAYERRLLPGASAFDRYVAAVEAGDTAAATRALSPAAVGGLKMFVSNETQCLRCHNGPLFTNGGFHNIGTGVLDGAHPDFGRMIGIQAIMTTDLTCLGPYSDDPKRDCPELRFLSRHDAGSAAGAYRVPSLRNVSATGPYMHDGRFSSLADVIQHYRNPGPNASAIEFRPLADMTTDHVDALVAFLDSLNGPVQAPPELLKPPSLMPPRNALRAVPNKR